jgi:hypothetical protein
MAEINDEIDTSEQHVENADDGVTEKEALAMGWTPKEKFRGNPEKWDDADAYVRRGKEIMPILAATNKRLKDEVAKNKADLAEMRASMESYKAFQKEVVEGLSKQRDESYAKAVADLKAARVEARRDGDDAKVDDLSDALADLKLEAAKKASEKPNTETKRTGPPDFTKTPEMKAWMADNKDWFGVEDDDWKEEKSVYAVAQGQLIRQKNPNITVEEFLERVQAKLDKFFPDEPSSRKTDEDDRPARSKVESGRRGSSSGPKGYADLPTDARAVCDADAKKFVGENKMYKTEKEWRTEYARQYFS